MTHPLAVVALASLQLCVATNMLKQFLRVVQHGTAHGAVVYEFLRRWLRRLLVEEVICMSCLLKWRWRRIIVLVVASRKLFILLQVVHELVDVEILKSGGAKEKSKIKTNQCWNVKNLRVQQIMDFRFNFDFNRLLVSVHCRPGNCRPMLSV